MLSIVTITKNDLTGLVKTLDSIRHIVELDGVESVIIDGGSTDGTLEYLQSISSNHFLWVSEPDSGISDAFNKGLLRSSKEFVLFLNSGDVLVCEELISLLAKSGDFDIFSGVLGLVSDLGDEVSFFRPKSSIKELKLRNIFPHQSTVCRRTLLLGVGGFDTELTQAMDYDIWIRIFSKFDPKVVVSNVLVANFLVGGTSANVLSLCLGSWKMRNKHRGMPGFDFFSNSVHILRLVAYNLFVYRRF